MLPWIVIVEITSVFCSFLARLSNFISVLSENLKFYAYFFLLKLVFERLKGFGLVKTIPLHIWEPVYSNRCYSSSSSMISS